MSSAFETRLAAAAAVASALAMAGPSLACDGAGVIIRIDGRPQDVQITRAAAQVSRPRVLEVVCRNDQIRALGDTSIVLSIDGAGTVRIGRGGAYTVPGRGGAPSLAGNVYRSIDEQVMPDMKRLPWNVRLKGAGDDFGFALPTLTGGGQKLVAGSRPLLVRLVGGAAPYKVEIKDAKGALVASQASDNHEVRLAAVALSPGAYHITASDSTPGALEADIEVVPGPPPSGDLTGPADPEVRVATASTLLARDHPGDWSFEAEQQLAAAPDTGLDRDKVYELIESYGSD